MCRQTLLTILFFVSFNYSNAQTWNTVGEFQLFDKSSATDADIWQDYAIMGKPAFRDNLAPEEDTGKVVLYKRGDDGVWLLNQVLVPPSSHYCCAFGNMVEIDEGLIAISSNREIYIYSLNLDADSWEYHETIYVSEFVGPKHMLSSLELSDERVFIGFRFWAYAGIMGEPIEQSGLALCYKLAPDNYFKHNFIIRSDNKEVGSFGESISYVDSILVIGASYNQDFYDHRPSFCEVYVYRLKKWSWDGPLHLQTIKEPNWENKIVRFGSNVMLSGDNIFISDPYADGPSHGTRANRYQGVVFWYKRYANEWVQHKAIYNKTPRSAGGFGYYLSKSNGSVLIYDSGREVDDFGHYFNTTGAKIFVYSFSGDSLALDQLIREPYGDSLANFGGFLCSSDDAVLLHSNPFYSHSENKAVFEKHYFFEQCKTAAFYSDTSCATYLFLEGVELDSTGVYYSISKNLEGCDSITFLSLTVPKLYVSITKIGDSLWSMGTAGSYSWMECSTEEILSNERFFIHEISGCYRLLVERFGCVKKSECYNYLSDVDCPTAGIPINAHRREFHLENIGRADVAVSVFDLQGRVVFNEDYHNAERFKVVLPERSGV